MNNRAQVSIEYLTMVMFGILLAVAAGVLLISVSTIASTAKAKVLTIRENAIANLLQ